MDSIMAQVLAAHVGHEQTLLRQRAERTFRGSEEHYSLKWFYVHLVLS